MGLEDATKRITPKKQSLQDAYDPPSKNEYIPFLPI